MPVTADLQPGQPPNAHAPLIGTFTAFHTLVGILDLTGDHVRLSATYADGHFSNWSYTGPDGVVVQLDLTRTK
jgi:hypothetical protein